MRLLFAYKHNPQDPSQSALKRWLSRSGYPVSFFRIRPNERRREDSIENRELFYRLCDVVEEVQPTHLLTWLSYINEKDVAWMQERGIKVAIALNGVTSFSSGITPDQEKHFEMLRLLDYYFVPHGPHVSVLRESGVKAFEMPLFYDPDVYKPLPAWKRLWKVGGSDVIFIGNFGPPDNLQRPHREALVRALGKHVRVRLISDFKLHAPGVRWHRPITLQPILNWMMNRSRIALGFDFFPDVTNYNTQMTNVVLPYGDNDKFTVRTRQFSTMGSGICMMVERHAEIQRLFEDGKHIILWSDIEEAVDRALYYFANSDELSAIARRGQEEVLQSHTAPIRIQQILDTMMNSPL